MRVCLNMRSILLSILLLLLSCGNDNKPSAQENIVDSIYKGSIKGRIYDENTDLPISGVIISTSPITSSSRTDQNGVFRISDISPGQYELIATHKDYISYNRTIKVSSGVENDLDIFITPLESVNTIPNKPTLLIPKDYNKISLKHIQFQWYGSDLDNDSLSYDVFFRTVGSDYKLIANNFEVMSFDYEFNFNERDRYQWYVVAKDKSSFRKSETFNFHYITPQIIDIPNMIGYWKFDGDANDYGPNRYSSSTIDVGFAADRYDNVESASKFTGKGNITPKVILPTTLQLTSDFTIALWIKSSSTSYGKSDNRGYYDCVSKWGDLKVNKASWAFGLNSSSNIFLITYNVSESKESLNFTGVTRGIWQHIAVTFSRGTASFYINGKLIKVAKNMNTPQESTYNTTIGARQNDISAFNGDIDDLYLFDRALTADEIILLFKQ